MSRRPRASDPARAGLLVLAALGACRSSGATPATAAEPSREDRRPAGVLFDPAYAPPPTEDRAEASAGVLSLRAPPAPRMAMRAIDGFFAAVVTKDMGRLSAIAAAGATAPSRARGAGLLLVEIWRARVAGLRYDLLRGEQLYRRGEIETYGYEDLDRAEPGRPARPPEMRPGDLLLRVPMAIVRAGSDRVFGDELVFVLVPSGIEYRIRTLLEDFQAP